MVLTTKSGGLEYLMHYI